MTTLKRKVMLRIRKSSSTEAKEPKATGWASQGGKKVWVYKPARLPYSSSHRKDEDEAPADSSTRVAA